MKFEEALQKAVYERLSNFPTMPPVYDEVPKDAPEHYVVIGEDTHAPYDTDDSVGSESTITLHIWSKSHRGKMQVKATQGLIYEALNRHELVVDDYDLVTLEFEYSEAMLDPDGLTRHGVNRYRALLEQSAAS
jgi:hypothetical protein